MSVSICVYVVDIRRGESDNAPSVPQLAPIRTFSITHCR